MANIQEAILQAVDTVVNNRVAQIATDKTVTATVAGCTNSLTGEYLVSYNGGKLKAFAQEGATYSQGQAVYVLIPEGDFTKQKNIIGVAQAAEDDNNISFVSSAISNYNLIGKNVLDDSKVTPVGLRSYKKEDYIVLYKRTEDVSGTKPQFLSIDVQELENNLKEAEAILIEASFRTSLPREHKLSKTGEYGLTFVLTFKDGDKTDDAGNALTKNLSYTIDSNSMTGSPFQYLQYFDQYQIFPIDIENFLYINQIIFYSKNFVEETDRIQSQDRPIGWGDDIFVKELEFYGLKKISATNGDYKLKLSMPQGSTLRSINSLSTLGVVGSLTKKNDNLSSDAMFYWFKEDSRVTASSSNYRMYGGAGWAYLDDKKNTYNFATTGSENRAYENKYLCVCVYKEKVVLKEEFMVYNESAKRSLSISSTLGTRFSFDRGEPTLTCLIDGNSHDFEENKANPHPDNYFRFVWSKVDMHNQVLTFNETKEELQQRYDQGLKDKIGYNNLSSIKNKMAEIEGASWNKNNLTYPIRGIDSSATFKCAVYLRDRNPKGDEKVEDIEYAIGVASIILNNEDVANPNDYYITIENGDQVFQYSESGVSPDDERYTDPLEVKPLTCHFFDPAGLEVNKNTYTVKWRVPLSDSLIVVPTEGMKLNESNQKIELCTSQIYPLAIKGDYDYSALNNQVEAIVTYQGVTYTQDTDFTFTKIGENGTNGTDIVAKISPTKDMGKELLAIVTQSLENKKPEWNSGQTMSEQVLTFELYQRNEKIKVDSNVLWSMGNGSNKYMSCSDGKVAWSADNAARRMFRNQIVKASTTYTIGDSSYNYYAFYPVPVIDYPTGIDKVKIGISKTDTLKSITYNADGRNPLYNKNQGVKLLDKGSSIDFSKLFFIWTAEGGQPTKTTSGYSDNPQNSCFKLIEEKNSADGKNVIGGYGMSQIYILPDDVYDGEYTNNLVHCEIYENELQTNPLVEIYIPIYMSLNTYGLKSLNQWDGNHIEINQDENYILAPQIGAGEKDNQNKFTGVVMGTAKTYDQKDASIGLLGYSHGKQSIYLDAENGSATFGLPENEASQNNKFEEGRIKLVPGGESFIGNWRIGSRALYNISAPEAVDGVFQEVSVGKPYKDYPVEDSQFAVPSNAQGMILGANPAYISVKGKPLTRTNSKIDWNGANTAIKPGDSLEVEIDPRKDSTFSIYRHTQNSDGSWRRYPLVGINQFGQFYTNAIEDGESSMGIGKIGAFGLSAADDRYIGAQFGWKGTNLFKFFTDAKDALSDEQKPLYLTSGSTVNNEYPRSMNIYGSSVNLYVPTSNTRANLTSNVSTNRISISKEEAFIGHANAFLTIPSDATSTTSLSLNNYLDIMNPNDRSSSWTTGDFTMEVNGTPVDDSTDSQGNYTENLGGNLRLNATNDIKLSADGSFHFRTSEEYNMYSKSYSSVTGYGANSAQWLIGANNNNSYLRFDTRNNDKSYTLLHGKGVKVTSDGSNAGVTIRSEKAPEGIHMQANVNGNSDANGVSFTMTPAADGNGTWKLGSGVGVITTNKAASATANNFVQITPGIGTPWINVTGIQQGTNSMSIVAHKDIKSNTGWMYAGDFSFNSAKSWNSMGLNRSAAKISDHLATIYSLLNTLNTNLNNEIKNRTSADSSLSTRINNVQATANSKVSTATFNAHKHNVGYSYVGTGSIIGNVKIDGDTYYVHAEDSRTMVGSVTSPISTPV